MAFLSGRKMCTIVYCRVPDAVVRPVAGTVVWPESSLPFCCSRTPPIYRLTKFVEWPEDASAQAPLTVCVIGNNALADLLEGVAKPQPTSDRGFAVRRINGASEARNCQVLYLAASQRRRVRAILSAISGSGILTIGETEGFTIQGCVIDFWIEANKLRFEVNTNAAARAHLKISSKLLSLAARVVKSDW
jgi:hypothetical protein